MRRSLPTSVILILAIIVLFVFEGRSTPAAYTQGTSSPRIAVVDLERVFEKSARCSRLEAEMQKEFLALQQSVGEKEKELDRLRGELLLLQSGSDEYRQIQTRIVAKGAVFELEKERAEKTVRRRHSEYVAKMIEITRAKVSFHANREGIDLVFQRRLTLQRDGHPWESVFHSRRDLDITGDVIALLDNE